MVYTTCNAKPPTLTHNTLVAVHVELMGEGPEADFLVIGPHDLLERRKVGGDTGETG